MYDAYVYIGIWCWSRQNARHTRRG